MVCVAGGHAWWGVCMVGGMHAKGGHGGGVWWGAYVVGDVCGGGRVWHACFPPTPRDMVGQCADGTHTTGMHFCFICHLSYIFIII